MPLAAHAGRRNLCVSLASWGLAAAMPGLAQAAPAAPEASEAPAAPTALASLAGLKRWGSGEFRRFGFLIYEATLWAGVDASPRPPLALQLTYRRAIAGRDIAAASIEQMRRFGASEAQLALWREQLTRLFPDVQAGDRLLGLQLPEQARFFHNDRALGSVEGADFAAAFFAIWLDPRTSAPELRTALLGRSGG